MMHYVTRALQAQDLDAIMAIEAASYSFPWSRGNFLDGLKAGYWAQGVWSGDQLLAYAWAVAGFEEAHLLNVAVHPDWRRQGLALGLLNALALWALEGGMPWIWLEVRASNQSAQQLYRRLGFEEAGLRRRYYPSARSTREDAVLMRLDVVQHLAVPCLREVSP